MPDVQLPPALAARFAELALGGIVREYPVYTGHTLLEAGDTRRPRELHPAFYGCFDWHSAVHSHWLLACLLRGAAAARRQTAAGSRHTAGPPHLSVEEREGAGGLLDPALADRIRAALNAHLTAEKLGVEAGYFREPGRRSFERPYGWAWLLKLAHELRGWDDPDARAWSAALEPLAALIADAYRDYLPRLTYPIRSGTHSSTAFGLDYAAAAGDAALRDLIIARSRGYFLGDRDAPAAYEPSGGDFLSPCLAEADLMRRVLPGDQFAAWLGGFLPGLADGGPPQLLAPAHVSDRSDGQIVHLDGLNLSRAWAMGGIAGALPPDDARRPVLRAAAAAHAEAGLAGVGSGDYMGDHWLASFALYLMTGIA